MELFNANNVSTIISGIKDAETARIVWKIFHSLSLEAMNRRSEIDAETLAEYDRRLRRLEMRAVGVIQGGGKKRKNRKKPKLKLIQ